MILKALQQYIEEYSNIKLTQIEFSEDGTQYREIELNTDRTEEQPNSYALSPAGNSLVKKDIVGNRFYFSTYSFYAKEYDANEIDRQKTHSFLECFQNWLEDRVDNDDLPVLEEPFESIDLEMSNGMLFDTYEDGTGLYQLQIKFEYKKKAEE